MSGWRMSGEPGLEELLDDDVMAPVVRSAGVSHDELRRQMSEMGHRLARGKAQETGKYDADFWELRAQR
jgi:hypothetical protein